MVNPGERLVTLGMVRYIYMHVEITMQFADYFRPPLLQISTETPPTLSPAAHAVVVGR